jgi:hypothetical protein
MVESTLNSDPPPHAAPRTVGQQPANPPGAEISVLGKDLATQERLLGRITSARRRRE